MAHVASFDLFLVLAISDRSPLPPEVRFFFDKPTTNLAKLFLLARQSVDGVGTRFGFDRQFCEASVGV
jgi:hypothetical protein